MIPLVDSLVQSGLSLGPKQCYSFKSRPPILGGEHSVENTEVCDIYAHYSLLGQIATQSKDLPEGPRLMKSESHKMPNKSLSQPIGALGQSRMPVADLVTGSGWLSFGRRPLRPPQP